MMKRISYLIILLILLSSISVVSAEDTFTITVNEKHIIGEGYSAYSGALFVLTESGMGGIGDVIVHSEDYYKIHQGDVVTLQAPDKYGYCNVLKINNMDNTGNSDWW